jgi:hypothetical protein
VPRFARVCLVGLADLPVPSLVLELVQQLPQVLLVSAKLAEETVRRPVLAKEIQLMPHSSHGCWCHA